jgi:hypothetical protein
MLLTLLKVALKLVLTSTLVLKAVLLLKTQATTFKTQTLKKLSKILLRRE